MEPRIDPEFRDLLRPLLDAEYAELRASIEREGCRDPLDVWQEEGILLDGHNRLRACTETGRPYEVRRVSIPNRGSALQWIVEHQLGRRNLTPLEVRYFLGKRYELERRESPHRRIPGCHGDTTTKQGSTDERIAQQSGVSTRTVTRASHLAAWIDTIARRVPGTKAELLHGTSRLRDGEIETLAGRRDIRTMEQFRGFVEECRRARSPRAPTSPERPFFQRSVVGLDTTNDPETGEEIVEAWRLVCGHVVRTKRRVLATTKTKTMACPECGSGTRTPFDRRRLREEFDAALAAALARGDARAHWHALARGAWLLATLAPHDARRIAVRSEVTTALSSLGLSAAIEAAEAGAA